ncbi:glycoside hydrolase family 35 protein [Microbacterium gorillae]|uniref:glycoside hydrolase family 35 protein n=1 Tax=Microbacterium gorillae TaxID=1231063 RepID=UPI003D994697
MTAPALTVGDGVLLRDGAEYRLLSGSIHYFRVHPAQWEDRLRRLAAMGANTVDTYVPWNFHERREGEFAFDGWHDLAGFIRLAGNVGLDVLLRPSPYICAEWNNGGLPSWLTARTRSLRSSDPSFLAAVDAWYDELIPRIAPLQASQGGPIVAVQVENEYGSFGSDRAYLEHLATGLRERGIVELLTTADGTRADMLNSGSVLESATPTFTFGTGAALADALRPAGAPLICGELWGGWFDHWGEKHHVRSAESMMGTVTELLELGGSVSLYMAHGGTNFGLWAGANWDGVLQPTVTSYDSDAPIGEDGTINDKFHALRAAFAPFHATELPSIPEAPVFQRPQAVPLTPVASLYDVVLAYATDGDLRTPMPQTFEELGQPDGVVAYRTVADLPGDVELSIDGLHDRAVIYVDGERVALLERDRAVSTMLAGPARRVELVIVVEALGRINYGYRLGEHKGITGVRLERRLVHGWSHTLLPESAWNAPEAPGADGVAVAEVQVTEVADAWIALPGGGAGWVWVNGFLLGRYDRIGPQVTLYAPAPLWREGANAVRVVDFISLPAQLEVRDAPDFGEVEEFIGY